MRTSLLLATVVLLLASSLPVASQGGGAFTVLVKGAQAEFTSDAWKDEQPLTGDATKTSPLPAVPNAIGTYQNPYFGAPHWAPAGPVNGWGYVLNLTLELGDASRQPLANAASNLVIDAKIKTGAGDIPAKITKLAPTTFRVSFDVDGEAGKPWPALLGGEVPVQVDVFEVPVGAQPRKIGGDAFPIRTTYALSSIPSIAFPREALQLYSDLGNLTPLATRAFAPGDKIPVTFSFGVPNANVRAVLLNTRATAVAFEGRTDATGSVAFEVTPATVLGDAAGGLVVVEAHLVGGPQSLSFGNGLVVLPVQSHATSVTAISRETRAGDDDPAATVRVTVSDPDAGPQTGGRHGRVVALDGVRVLANVPFLPAEPGQTDVNHKYARYLARLIAEADVSSYTLYSLLFTERNEFYSLAIATRGYSIGAAPVDVPENERGILRLTVRNLNSNGDDRADYGLATTVRLAVTGLPGGGNWTGEASLSEAGTAAGVLVLEVPFAGFRAGAYSAVVNSSADELRIDRTVAVRIQAPQGALGGFLDRLTPAPGVVAFLALAAVAAALAARRR